MVKERLRESECKQGELADCVSKEAGVGKRATLQLVKRHIRQPTYLTVEASGNNAKLYKKW